MFRIFLCGGGRSLLWLWPLPLWTFHSSTSPCGHFNPPLPLRTFYCFTSPHGQFINSPPPPPSLFITSPLPPPVVTLLGEEHSLWKISIYFCDDGASRPCEHQFVGVLVSLPFSQDCSSSGEHLWEEIPSPRAAWPAGGHNAKRYVFCAVKCSSKTRSSGTYQHRLITYKKKPYTWKFA